MDEIDNNSSSTQDHTRDEIIEQLRKNLSRAQNKLEDHTLTPLELQHWIRVHTNIALVLNTVLRDSQFREWEKRMRILEKYGLLPDDRTNNSEP